MWALSPRNVALGAAGCALVIALAFLGGRATRSESPAAAGAQPVATDSRSLDVESLSRVEPLPALRAAPAPTGQGEQLPGGQVPSTGGDTSGGGTVVAPPTTGGGGSGSEPSGGGGGGGLTVGGGGVE